MNITWKYCILFCYWIILHCIDIPGLFMHSRWTFVLNPMNHSSQYYGQVFVWKSITSVSPFPSLVVSPGRLWACSYKELTLDSRRVMFFMPLPMVLPRCGQPSSVPRAGLSPTPAPSLRGWPRCSLRWAEVECVHFYHPRPSSLRPRTISYYIPGCLA